MTPEIIARVDSWLRSRKAWLLASEYRDWLHYEWAVAVARYNSHERSCRRDAVAAVLAGLLLALVREAWGDPTIHPKRTYGFNPRWTVQTPEGSCTCGAGHHYGDDVDEALLSALEAAPR